MNDEEIIKLFFERDETAVSEIREKYGKLCMRIAENITGSHSDAEEIVNDGLLSLWKAIPPLNPGNLRAYLIKTVRNLSLKRLSYNMAEKRRGYMGTAFEELEDVLPDKSAKDELDRIDLDILMGDFLKSLKPEARMIFVRRYFFFDSVANIAGDMKISGGKVKSSLYRTRANLKKFLTGKGK